MKNLFMFANRNNPAFEVEEELRFHIEMLEHKYAQQGMCAADANAAAMKRFGNLERVQRQCVNISTRNSFVVRFLKTSAILIALAGIAIQLSSSDYKVERMGHVLVIIAVLGRLLLYVRGLGISLRT